jgi:hypothetical protein
MVMKMANPAVISLSRITEGSKADMDRCVALVPSPRQLAFAGVTMNSGTFYTAASAKPYQPPLVAVASFKQAAYALRVGLVMSSTTKKGIQLASSRREI